MSHIRERINSKSIRLASSDIFGKFVVIPRQLDVGITEKHLHDVSLYRPSSEEEYKEYRYLNGEWIKTTKAAGWKQSVIRQLNNDLPSFLFYKYLLRHIKSLLMTAPTDPTTFDFGPIIISCVGGPTDRIAWFLSLILSRLLRSIPVHLPNTDILLERLDRVQPNLMYAMESFDVTALHTNVSNDAAI